MARLIKALCVPSIGSWLFLFAMQQLVAQQAAAQEAVEVPGAAIRITDLGLEDEIPSAIDLVGPEHGSAGRNRERLAHRLQCWVDGDESCTVADRNDDRIRDIRRFLVEGPMDRDGMIRVHFPDQTHIELVLVRTAALDPIDWEQQVYRPVVLAETVEAPGLAAVPSNPGQFTGSDYQGAPAIRSALERLKQRLDAPVQPDRTSAVDSSDDRPPLLQGRLP